MVEGAVSFFLDKLSLLIEEETSLLVGVDQQVKILRQELQWIMCFVQDAEKKRRKSPLVDIWVKDLIELAYDVEDVVDAYMLHQEKLRIRNLVSKMIHFPNKVWALHKLGKEIKEVNINVRNISARKSDYGLQVLVLTQESSVEDMASTRRRFPAAPEFDVVGLQKESAQLAGWLKSRLPQRRVISIVGMGGLGKTTLTEKVCKYVSSHFDVRVWIYVSQEYKVRDLLSSALKKLTSKATDGLEKMDSREMQEELCKLLHSKKYLVVIDDIWQVEAWDAIRGAFPNNENGSRLILTTRNKEVAMYANPSGRNHLELSLLNKDESWELFCKKVFSMSDGICSPELVKLGKEIVDKCAGLPLAIVVIGGLLMGKERTPHAWFRVLGRVTWQLSQETNQCREILHLSYIDLPYALKSCFLYLGLFPEDYVIYAHDIICLWVAEGFVQARGEQKMEDVAEDYLEELVQRSMIQVVERAFYGGPVKMFRVHDLMRDLAISEATKDRFLDIHPNNHYTTSTTRSRKFAVHSTTTSEQVRYFSDPKLRSLIVYDEMLVIGKWKSTFGDGKRMLRVLNLKGVRIGKRSPEEIGELVFLHYLGLRDTKLTKLPDSIGNLVKLQTLDVFGTLVACLPETMWKLKNLRHLLLPDECLLFKRDEGAAIKGGFGRNLLTLFVSGSIWMTKDGGLSNDLVKLGCLQSLMVRGRILVNNNDRNLRNCFPSSLAELRLIKTYIEEDPSDVLGSLPNLRALTLSPGSYRGKVMVFPWGGFPKLQFLTLSFLEDLIEWRVADGATPILLHLAILSCNALNNLPDGLKNVTTLQKIQLKYMPGRFKDRVKEKGEDWDKIKHIPIKEIE